jgi:hypothetical protein
MRGTYSNYHTSLSTCAEFVAGLSHSQWLFFHVLSQIRTDSAVPGHSYCVFQILEINVISNVYTINPLKSLVVNIDATGMVAARSKA